MYRLFRCVCAVSSFFFMIASAFAGHGLRSTTWLWRDGIVQYEFLGSCDVYPEVKQAVRKAMRTWEDDVGGRVIRFQEDKSFKNRVYIDCTNPSKEYAGGESPAGYTHMTDQKMRIDPNDRNVFGIALHELGHVLGLKHEQQRNDTGDHMVINWDNIREECLAEYREEETFAYGKIGTFDFDSVMLYSSFACAKNKTLATATRLNGETFTANRSVLSAGDANAVRSIYTDLLHTPSKKLDYATRSLQLVNKELKNCKVEIDGGPKNTKFEDQPAPDEDEVFLLDFKLTELRSNRAVKSKYKLWLNVGNGVDMLRHEILNGFEGIFPGGPKCLGDAKSSDRVRMILIEAQSYSEKGCAVSHKGIPYRHENVIFTNYLAHGEACPNDYGIRPYLNIHDEASERLVASQVAHLLQNFGDERRPKKIEGTMQIPENSLVEKKAFKVISLSAPQGGKISGKLDCNVVVPRDADMKDYTIAVTDLKGRTSREFPCAWDLVIPATTSPVIITLSPKLEGAKGFSSLGLSFLHIEGSTEEVEVKVVR